MSDFENGVNALLPLKVGFPTVPVGGNATAGYFPRFTGIGLTCEQVAAIGIQQAVTVGKSGAQFTTIQAAIDSVLDATSTKQYSIQIYPGTYVENITLKPYVHITGVQGVSSAMGTSYAPVVLAPTGGDIFTVNVSSFSQTVNIISNLVITVNASSGDTFLVHSLLDNTQVSGILFTGCTVSVGSATGGSGFLKSDAVYSASASGGFNMQVYDCYFNMTTGTSYSGQMIGFDIVNLNSKLYISNSTIYSISNSGGMILINYRGRVTSSAVFAMEIRNSTLRSISRQNAACWLYKASTYFQLRSIGNVYEIGANAAVTVTNGYLFDVQPSVASANNILISSNDIVNWKVVTNKNFCLHANIVVSADSAVTGGGTVSGTGTFTGHTFPDYGHLQLEFGAAINELSIDGALADNSDTAVPTEKAVKTYALGFGTAPVGGNATAGKIPRFTGTGVTISQEDATFSYYRTYTVGPAGGGFNYTSLLTAVAALPGDITTANPFTILVEPGIYTETGRLILTNIAGLNIVGRMSNIIPTVLVGSVIKFTDPNIGVQLIGGCNIKLINIAFTTSFTSSTIDYNLVNVDNTTTCILTLYNSRLQLSFTSAASNMNYQLIKVTGVTGQLDLYVYDTSALSLTIWYGASYKLLDGNAAREVRFYSDRNSTIAANVGLINSVQTLCDLPTSTSVGLSLANSTITLTPRVLTGGAPILGPYYFFNMLNEGASIIKNCVFNMYIGWAAFASDSTNITIIKSSSSIRLASYFNSLRFASSAGMATIGTPKYLDSPAGGSPTPGVVSVMDSLAGAIFDGGVPIVSQVGSDKDNEFKSSNLVLSTGAVINEFSTDGTLAGNSDAAVPTEQAVKTYADTKPTISSGTTTPSSTPGKVGDIYVDTTGLKLYFSTGTSSSADWVAAN